MVRFLELTSNDSAVNRPDQGSSSSVAATPEFYVDPSPLSSHEAGLGHFLRRYCPRVAIVIGIASDDMGKVSCSPGGGSINRSCHH